MAIGSNPPTDPNPRIAILEQQVAQLQGEVEQLKRNVATPQEQAVPIASELNDIVRMTEKLFGETPTLLAEFDPEYPDEKWIAFKVPFGGTPRDAVDRRVEWHRKVDAMRPDSVGQLRLAITTK